MQESSTRRPNTPIKIVKKFNEAGLKGYPSSSDISDGPKHTVRVGSRGMESLHERNAEVLYTFYTKDEDLRARGRSIYSEHTTKEMHAYLQTKFKGTHQRSDDIDGHKRKHGRHGWDTTYTAWRRTVASRVCQELAHHPNRFSQSHTTIQWMLEVYGDTKKRLPLYDKDVCTSTDAYRRYHADSVTERYDKDGRYYRDSYGHGKPKREFFRTHGYRRPGDYYNTCTTPQKLFHTFEGDAEVDDEVVSHRHGPEFEWSELHPVVRTTSKFLIDKSQQGFLSKSSSLPPLVTRTPSRGSNNPLQLRRQNIIRIKMPKLPVQA